MKQQQHVKGGTSHKRETRVHDSHEWSARGCACGEHKALMECRQQRRHAGLAPTAEHGHGRPAVRTLGERRARSDARWGATLLTGERFSPSGVELYAAPLAREKP